jgi:phage tail-like protein
MANVSNPHKKFQFSIAILGMNPFLAQKVTTAERDLDQVEHGEGNHVIKTAGMVKLGNIMVEKISSADGPDRLFWDWIASIQNEFIGGGLIPDNYKFPIQIQKYATDGLTVIATWNYIGCWVKKINGVELDRVSSENTIESLELSVDRQAYL